MPLQIQVNNQHAQQVYQAGISLNGRYRYDVGMGGYAVAHNLAHATALGTSGALTCLIIVVHKAPGHGALGHYAAHPDPGMIVQGVQDMVMRLGGPPIDRVVLAAGLIGGGRSEQLKYEIGVVGGVRALFPDVRVVWPAAPVHDLWGACYYLPLAEVVGLTNQYYGGFTGTGNPQDGIDVHNY